MRKTILVTIALAALVGCAHRRSENAGWAEPASDNDKTAARTAFITCMRVRVPKLDDGISDASTIAAAVRVSCPDEWNLYAALLHQGRSAALYDAIEKGAEDGQRELALVVVLETREKRRATRP